MEPINCLPMEREGILRRGGTGRSDATRRAQAHPTSDLAPTLAGMSFQPYRDSAAPTPCWFCTSFDRMADHGAALCAHPGCCRVRASPERGCSCWERLVGVDDEPWVPVIVIRALPQQQQERLPVAWAP